MSDLECVGVLLFYVSLLLENVELKCSGIGPSVAPVPNLELVCALSCWLPVCLPHAERGILEDTLLGPLLRVELVGSVEPEGVSNICDSSRTPLPVSRWWTGVIRVFVPER